MNEPIHKSRTLAHLLQHSTLPGRRGGWVDIGSLSESNDMAAQVGSRHDNPVVLFIEIPVMIQDGDKFYKAQNGVWLSDDIPIRYINRRA